MSDYTHGIFGNSFGNMFKLYLAKKATETKLATDNARLELSKQRLEAQKQSVYNEAVKNEQLGSLREAKAFKTRAEGSLIRAEARSRNQDTRERKAKYEAGNKARVDSMDSLSSIYENNLIQSQGLDEIKEFVKEGGK